MGEKIKVNLHDLSVVGDRFANSRPIIAMACAKVGGIEVAFGLSQCKLIGHVNEPRNFDSGDVQSRNVIVAVVEHR